MDGELVPETEVEIYSHHDFGSHYDRHYLQTINQLRDRVGMAHLTVNPVADQKPIPNIDQAFDKFVQDLSQDDLVTSSTMKPLPPF